MRPSVLFLTVWSLLAACGPNVVERASVPSSAAAVEEADETAPTGERLERRLVLVRRGAPLRYAPEEAGEALRDEAWSSKAELTGDDEQHCTIPSPSFRGLALRLFVKKEDLALVLSKWQGAEFGDGTSLKLHPGIQVGARDPQPAHRGMEHHLVELHGRRLLVELVPERLGWSYVPREITREGQPAAQVVREDARAMVGGKSAVFGLEPSRDLGVQSSIDIGGGKSLATLRLPCAEMQAVARLDGAPPHFEQRDPEPPAAHGHGRPLGG